MTVFLIGYRGAGKTSVARRLARKLGRDWIDTDTLVQQQTGRSIRQIFEAQGEAAFREIEFETIQTLFNHHLPGIVSMGGGAVLHPVTRRRMAESGKCVWLRCDAQTLCQRMDEDPLQAQRPPLTELERLDEIQQLLAQRVSIYDACADYIVDNDHLTVAQTVDEIARWLDTVDT